MILNLVLTHLFPFIYIFLNGIPHVLIHRKQAGAPDQDHEGQEQGRYGYTEGHQWRRHGGSPGRTPTSVQIPLILELAQLG